MKNNIIFCFLILTSIFLSSCNEEITDNLLENKPPDTHLFLKPDSTISQQQSRLQVFWYGDDPDGLVQGFYFSWGGEEWIFTTNTDSLFALQIGAKDTNYTFYVSSVDDGGNGVYDNFIQQNGINYGSEPFVDKNNNGKYDSGEKYFDIGLIDPTPAELNFPIKNTSPTIEWSVLTVLPDTSLPVMSFGWNAEDIDGNESIQKINIAINDTTQFVTLDGAVRFVTLRTNDVTSDSPQMEILINGSVSNIFPQKLNGLNYNQRNRVYIQAVDISGGKTEFVPIPDSTKKWVVKKPKNGILIIDDYTLQDNASSFYTTAFSSISGTAKYDVWDLAKHPVPYESITFLETLKLFKGVFWYSDNEPDLSLASSSVQKYIESNGKIAFSMLFSRTIDQMTLQSFLPVDSTDNKFLTSLFSNTDIVPDSIDSSYPALVTSSSINIVRTFYPNELGAVPVYRLNTTQINGKKIIAFKDKENKLFFFGLPLHKCNGSDGNVSKLLERVFIQDFGLSL